jgi:hypothetical protein
MTAMKFTKYKRNKLNSVDVGIWLFFLVFSLRL